ncbi:MAG: VOC family protein [Rhodococcus sp. (in: high G+C Gram-positive bacteria)]
MPVRRIDVSIEYYCTRIGFSVSHADDSFAKLCRDDAEIHLWVAFDDSWQERPDFRSEPVCSGAESFIAGTASCRIDVDLVDELYIEMAATGVLHPGDTGSPIDTDYGTREFAVLDLDGNLLTFACRRH